METDHVRRATSRAGSPLIAEASGATLASSIANLTNTNVGVGMLAMPAALASAGWVGGLSLLAFAALASAFASSLLVDCVDHVHNYGGPRLRDLASNREDCITYGMNADLDDLCRMQIVADPVPGDCP